MSEIKTEMERIVNHRQDGSSWNPAPGTNASLTHLAQSVFIGLANQVRQMELGKTFQKQSTGGDNYTLNVQNLHGGVQQGSGNTQNIQINITHNPEFDQAIADLLQLIEGSRLPADDIEELKDEAVKLNRLALSEPKPGLLEKAKARIDVMKVAFEGAKLLVQAAPYLHTAWDYFKVKHS